MDLTFEEIRVIRDSLGKAPLSQTVISAINKFDDLIREHGYKRERVALPKEKFQKKTYYEYIYTKLN